MNKYDLVIRGGKVVRKSCVEKLDIGVVQGKIVELDVEIHGSYKQEINAFGKHILPGGYDCHVHFNDPGRTEWETIETGTKSLAAGGMTLFTDMPLNSIPLTLDGNSFEIKNKVAESNSYVDFSFWGGLTPDNIDSLDELAEKGVVGYKAFMCNSGIEEFRYVDEESLYKGLLIAEKHDLPVIIHAEDQEAISKNMQGKKNSNNYSYKDFLNSRPQETEIESVIKILEVLKSTNAKVHIAHVSSPEVIKIIKLAKQDGLRITCETVPQYLMFDEDIFESLNGLVKSCPPIRDSKSKEKLWDNISTNEIDIISSDHSPSTKDLKTKNNFFDVWGGIAGCQSTLNVLITEGHMKRDIPLEDLIRLVSYNPAKIFNIHEKGQIEIGYDADFSIVDIEKKFELKSEDLYYKNKISPYVGMIFNGKVDKTFLRGEMIYCNGFFLGKPQGRLVKPKVGNRINMY